MQTPSEAWLSSILIQAEEDGVVIKDLYDPSLKVRVGRADLPALIVFLLQYFPKVHEQVMADLARKSSAENLQAP